MQQFSVFMMNTSQNETEKPITKIEVCSDWPLAVARFVQQQRLLRMHSAALRINRRSTRSSWQPVEFWSSSSCLHLQQNYCTSPGCKVSLRLKSVNWNSGEFWENYLGNPAFYSGMDASILAKSCWTEWTVVTSLIWWIHGDLLRCIMLQWKDIPKWFSFCLNEALFSTSRFFKNFFMLFWNGKLH